VSRTLRQTILAVLMCVTQQVEINNSNLYVPNSEHVSSNLCETPVKARDVLFIEPLSCGGTLCHDRYFGRGVDCYQAMDSNDCVDYDAVNQTLCVRKPFKQIGRYYPWFINNEVVYLLLAVKCFFLTIRIDFAISSYD
jgi:hypothetical protein